ncbi:MAG: hypothetical protein ACREJ2_00480 [Planctomycetota bacterium]
MRCAPFTVDLTPPPGFPLAYGFNTRADGPIHLRGVVLEDGARRTVLAAAEVIGFYGGAYGLWRRALASATGTPVGRVLLHAVHQHDSLLPLSPRAVELLHGKPGAEPGEGAAWRALLARTAGAIRAQIAPRRAWRTVARVGTAERRLTGLAGNRRMLDADGKVFAMRWSMTPRRDLKRLPVGNIDPLLRSVGLFDARGELLASLHFYASHPMAAYGRQRACADVPGVALAALRRAQQERGTHLYFTGCAADVTFGKYTTPDLGANLRVLGGRLGAGLCANVAALRPEVAPRLSWRRRRFALTLAARLKAATLRAEIAAAPTRHDATWKAVTLEAVEDWRRLRRAEALRLTLAPGIHVISLPSEIPVEFQQFAQAQAPEHYVACAAYADMNYQYLSPPHFFREGGYEPSANVATGQGGEACLTAIAALLADLS